MGVPRRWPAHATFVDGRPLRFGVEHVLRMVSPNGDIRPVTLLEDADGPLRGWIPTGADTPTHVVRRPLFDIHFPGGHTEEEAKGRGHHVDLIAEVGAV